MNKNELQGNIRQLTWVWRKRGITSLKNLCGTSSFVPRGKCVEAPPAPSPIPLVATAGRVPRDLL